MARGWHNPCSRPAVTVAPGVVVGSRVSVTEETGDDKAKRVTVKLEG